jgi:hypothetical protein
MKLGPGARKVGYRQPAPIRESWTQRAVNAFSFSFEPPT